MSFIIYFSHSYYIACNLIYRYNTVNKTVIVLRQIEILVSLKEISYEELNKWPWFFFNDKLLINALNEMKAATIKNILHSPINI